jgi:predicted RNA-binding protein YlxR (DUF448 family)
MGVPERTCVSCRKKGGKGELIKLALAPSGVVVDYNERLPGRGAYVCPGRGCIDDALDGRALSRAFKCKVPAQDKPLFYEELTKRVEKKAASLLGMSKKSGHVAAGFDAAVEAARKHPGGLFVLAHDISENTGQKLMGALPTEGTRMVKFSSKDGLGMMLGGQPVAVVYISEHGLAAALYREIDRLNNMIRG